MEIYELYNTQTEQIEAQQPMNQLEADKRNSWLRQNGEPRRWVKQAA